MASGLRTQESTTVATTESPDPALIDQCVHCGFCLPTCPTYMLWGEEMDSPRGRIYLMKAGVDGRTSIDANYVQHFDACLGCVSCMTACPSGVQYGQLIEQTRAQIEREFDRPPLDRFFRTALLSVVPYPARMRVVLLPLLLFGGLIKRLAAVFSRTGAGPAKAAPHEDGPGTAGYYNPGITPRSTAATFLNRLGAAMTLSPPVTWRGLFATTATETPAAGAERMKVAVLTGCVQRISFADVNEATVRVLVAEGCRVKAPAAQGCCGALALHAGYSEQARALARHNIEVFESSGVDRIVVNAAGCGSAMKEYGHLFAGDSQWASRATAFSAKVRDVSEVLTELGDSRATRQPIGARVVYHDACHLAHGQGIRTQPRALLQAIPGIELLTPAESDICCGSAGIYNLVQPEPAAQLGARKARNIAALSPDLIATANPGCTLQIAAAARNFGYNWPIFHPIQLIDASIRGVDPRRDN
jgi:glycolate oxidase iron-sulfur subunit